LMDIYLFFRKKTPLTEEGMPWLSGAEEHSQAARRNTSGRAAVSAVLVRSLLACLDGAVVHAETDSSGDIIARVRSSSAPHNLAHCALKGQTFCLPHGEPNKVTYHVGVLALLRALLHPAQAADLWSAYQALQIDYQANGRVAAIKDSLCRACDELYFWARYANLDPAAENDRLASATVSSNSGVESGYGASIDLAPLTDPAALQRMRGQESAPLPVPAPEEAVPVDREPSKDGFVGWQIVALAEALAAGENILLAGPTGTGKTACFQQVASASLASVVAIEGKEGLTDLDFLGAILPQPDNSRRWVDGPLLRAMRLAQEEPVWLFLDEINRIPRRHVNLLLTLLNPKPGEFCRQMGFPVLGDYIFYMVETPMTSETVCCPAQHLRIVAAGNFGRAYAIYDLDPALRRRFDTILEFDYLEARQELALVQKRTRLNAKIANALVQVAQETRRLMGNGEMPGCVDTATLLNWAAKCARLNACSVDNVMQVASLTWADTVCGRDHQGRVNSGNFKAIQDYLNSLDLLPAGGSE